MTAPDTLALLDRLDALATEATPGPWHWYADTTITGGLDKVWANDGDELALCFGAGDLSNTPEDDAAYIAACDPATIRRLVALARLGAAGLDVEEKLPLSDPPWMLKLSTYVRLDGSPLVTAEAWAPMYQESEQAFGPTPVAALLALRAELEGRG